MTDPIAVIEKFYTPGTQGYDIFMAHGEAVRDKALSLARRLDHRNPDYEFIASAAMLHDIGIFQTNAPILQCHGKHPYVCHGFIGKDLLDELGLPRHALVCERHVGLGISEEDVIAGKLPLPKRDMRPQTLEEELICYADKFYSKLPLPPLEKSMEDVMEDVKKNRYGENKMAVFMEWTKRFGC
ncbi:MAG: HD domain-containing protein [Proteobacteria bacterium]|nr:HD domain-containing protein [Pseudomonadota bacterium]